MDIAYLLKKLSENALHYSEQERAYAVVRDLANKQDVTKCKKCGSERVWYRDGKNPNGSIRYRLSCRSCAGVKRRKIIAAIGGSTAFLNRKKSTPEGLAKYRAHKAVEHNIASDKLQRKPCEVLGCGKVNTHAHHEDYSKPLDIIWLCPQHHKDRHREMDNSSHSAEAIPHKRPRHQINGGREVQGGS